jgi:hypothetical protein
MRESLVASGGRRWGAGLATIALVGAPQLSEVAK